MKLVTWNVNSIRAREDRLLGFLERESPDVLCLQELKGVEESFPHEVLQDAGYHAAVYGQKTYNGVAILSRTEPEDVRRGMGPEDDDPQARLVSAVIDGVRVVCAYFPNGKTVGSSHYDYKLQWMGRLHEYLTALVSPDEDLVLTGDFNVAPDDDGDVENPKRWGDSVLCHETVRAALERIRALGFVDVFREQYPDGGVYTWWDYRALAFPKNDGLRIDHVFATEGLAERCTAARVDRDERKKGKVGKPSDHAPVIVEFDGE